MRKLFALLSLLVIASMALAACGTPAPAEAPAAEAPVAEAPMAEGFHSADPTTFVVATIGEPETLDPALAYETAGGEIIQNVYETLVFYDGEATDKFVPMLAESWEVSDDGMVYTFKMRSGVKFHDGADLTASDVAYSFQRGLLFGGYSGPQWLLAEPFFGIGTDDISIVVANEIANGIAAKVVAGEELTFPLFGGVDQAAFDEAMADVDVADADAVLAAVSGLIAAPSDDRELLSTADAAALAAACEKVTGAIVADDAAGTVTMTLAQGWGPFIPTIAQTWGSAMDKDWTVANGGWDGDCATWQNFYAEPSESDPFTTIMNGTGPFKLDHWTQGEELVLVRNDAYWQEPAKLERVVIKSIDEWGTR
ncbi:MAG: ABC transporter substrate-binding protein, partial [Anaerolineales bacterium]|nr:ABC transporter substrate-binding protein [Anaerolineales bacterium]